jgi:hypothetical protein
MAPVVDSNKRDLAILKIYDAHHGAEWQRAMSGRHRLLAQRLAAGGLRT